MKQHKAGNTEERAKIFLQINLNYHGLSRRTEVKRDFLMMCNIKEIKSCTKHLEELEEKHVAPTTNLQGRIKITLDSDH